MPTPIAEDPVLLLTALAAWANDEVLRRLSSAGYADVRVSHGYVFQHVQGGPIAVGELAARLGMTAQGASKAVAELEDKGYLRRRTSPDDQRTRLVEMTDRGWAAVEAAREARKDVNARIVEVGGQALADALARLAEGTGALEAMAGRRLRPPR